MKQYKFVDLFAGCGGLSLGLQQAGFTPWFVNEIVEQFCNTYKFNHDLSDDHYFVGDIAEAITTHTHKNGYQVVRDYCGHGVGLEFHEEPEVCHYGKAGTGMLLVPGMVFTIEPMINMGTWEIFIDEETGWTAVTEDELPSAQWEHTFLMTDNGLEILTH